MSSDGGSSVRNLFSVWYLFCDLLVLQCFCSASGDDYDALGTATCNYECGGDASETCGGFYAMSVYEYDDAADDDVGDGVDDGDYTYVGCYFDTKTSRVLSGSSTSSSSMTTNACYTFCEGSAYFGTEYGIEVCRLRCIIWSS